MSIRARLVWLVLVLALPLALIAAAGLYASYRSERRATADLLQDTARALALAVDREVGKARVTLDVLARSAVLDRDDLPAFETMIRRVADGPDRWLGLFEPDGQLLISTAYPRGAALPRSPRTETLRRIAETGRGEVSGVFVGSITRRRIIVVEVPVIREGRARYVLSMGLAVDTFAALARDLSLAPGWIATVLDRDGRVVSRSRAHEDLVGVQGPEPFLQAIAARREGTIELVSLDGSPVLTAFGRSPEHGLVAAVSFPLAEFAAALRRSLWWMIALLAGALAGLAAAVAMARNLAAGVSGLAAAARSLGEGGAARLGPTGLREVDRVARELAQASRLRQEAEARIRTDAARLAMALEAGDLGEWEFDPGTGTLASSAACKAKFGRGPDEPFAYADLEAAIHPDDLERQRRAVAEAIASGGAFEVEYRVIRPDAALRWVEVRGRCFERGGATRLIGVSRDVTARRTADDRQALLLHELNHRVKNTLATVQSIAMMTFRSAGDPAAAWETFQSRILGMAKTHDLLTESQWEGVPLRQLLDNELEPYQDVLRRRVSLRGPALTLGPRAALALGLAVHELATNAAKYGSLSVDEGRLFVRWANVRIEGLPHLLVEWDESKGPPVAPPTRQGFGTRLIQRGLAQELGGAIKLHFEPTGLRCVITFPLHSLEDARATEGPGRADVQPFG